MFQSQIYSVPIHIEEEHLNPVLQAAPVSRVDEDIWKRVNNINILGVLQVNGYCIMIEGRLLTYIFARDIAIGGGLTNTTRGRYATESGCTTSCTTDNRSYEVIRWNTFTEYFNDAVEEISLVNPDLLQFIQPLDTNSYILLEVALGILNRCNNKIAKQFRGKLLYIAVPYIQQQVLQEYNIKIEELKNLSDCYWKDKRILESRLGTAHDILNQQSKEIGRLENMKNVTENDLCDALATMTFGEVIDLVQKSAR